MSPNQTCVSLPGSLVVRGTDVARSWAEARFVPKIWTNSPRAATGTLEALLPVAAFSNPCKLTTGACPWEFAIRARPRAAHFIGRSPYRQTFLTEQIPCMQFLRQVNANRNSI